MTNETQGAVGAETKTAVDWDRLSDLFSRMPSGPWNARRDTDGHEIRQIDTDPTNKHHWPFRLCRSIPGQRAVCDDAVFEFLAGVLNAWPQIAAERSEDAEIERILAMPEDELRKRCLVDGQSPEQSVRIADFAFECASLRAALIRISSQYVTHRGDLEDAKALRAIKEIADTALATPRTDSAEGTAGASILRSVSATDKIAELHRQKLKGIRSRWEEGAFLDDGEVSFLLRIAEMVAGNPVEPRYQYREIGEGEGWRDCSRESYMAFASDPHIDTREVAPAPSSPGVPDSVREAVARLINPVAFNTGPEAFGMSGENDPAWKRTLPYAARLIALDRADEVVALLSAHPAGQSTGPGVEDEDPRETIRRLERELGVKGAAAVFRRSLELAKQAAAYAPAPESPLTGPVGVKEESEGLMAQVSTDHIAAFDDIARDLTNLYAPDGPPALRQGILAALMRVHLAARPAAPEAQGAWMPIETAPQTDEDIWVACYRLDKHGKPYSFVTESSYEDTEYRRGFRHRNGAWGALYWQPKPKAPTVPEGHFNDTAPPSSGQGGR